MLVLYETSCRKVQILSIMSPSDSELNFDSSDDFSDEDRPVLAMLSSSSSKDELDAMFSVDSDVHVSSS